MAIFVASLAVCSVSNKLGKTTASLQTVFRREDVVPKIRFIPKSCYKRRQVCCYRYHKCGHSCRTGYCSQRSMCTMIKFGKCFRWRNVQTCQTRCFDKLCARFECNPLAIVKNGGYVPPRIHQRIYYPGGRAPPKIPRRQLSVCLPTSFTFRTCTNPPPQPSQPRKKRDSKRPKSGGLKPRPRRRGQKHVYTVAGQIETGLSHPPRKRVRSSSGLPRLPPRPKRKQGPYFID